MMRQRLTSTVLHLVLLLVMVPGCAPVTVRHTTLQSTYTTAVQADVISTGELSQLTQQVLRMAALPTATQNPFGTFQALDQQGRTEQDQRTQVALVEFALWQALQQATTNPTAAPVHGPEAHTARSGNQLYCFSMPCCGANLFFTLYCYT